MQYSYTIKVPKNKVRSFKLKTNIVYVAMCVALSYHVMCNCGTQLFILCSHYHGNMNTAVAIPVNENLCLLYTWHNCWCIVTQYNKYITWFLDIRVL